MTTQKNHSQFIKEYNIVNLEERERILPYHLPVIRIGVLPRKKQWVDEKIMTGCSFNIILNGSGYLRYGKNVINLEAPCLFSPSAFPGCTYGPHDAWEELFIIYPDNACNRLRDAGYLIAAPDLHQNLNIGRLLPILNELITLMDDMSRPGTTDRLDHLCESIIREAILSKNTAIPGLEYKIFAAIRDNIRSNFANDPDIVKLARQCGMSQSTFRRNWAKYFGSPPKRYIAEVRIKHACRHLMDNNLAIKDIAYTVGFNDPLYFSKAFRKYTGMTPSEFRAQCIK
jgi:AraC-like DNA-binding protein